MATIISIVGSTTKIQPALVLGYESARSSRNIVHEVLGTGKVNVTFRPSPSRSGTLRMLFLTEQAAADAEYVHHQAYRFTLADVDRPSIAMSYVVKGDITRELDPQTRKLWTVNVPFVEYQP
jgi:hypothetical protein